MDLITIIISTYKGESGILECVKAALSQEYENYEVIVVDDNGRGTISQKNTERLLSQFRSNDKFRYIIHETNRNGSAARNTGIRNARGTYLAFLDDDDILMPDSIRLRYEKLSKMPKEYGIVFSSFEQYVDGKKDFDCIYEFEGDILEDYLLEKIHSPSSVLMVRKSVIEHIGLWDEDFRRHQDWEFVTRVLVKYRACSIQQITVKRIVTWRNNAKVPELFEKQRLFFLDKMKPIIEQQEKTTQQAIYYAHFVDIGKNYLKHKKVMKALAYAFYSKKPLAAIGDYMRACVRYAKK